METIDQRMHPTEIWWCFMRESLEITWEWESHQASQLLRVFISVYLLLNELGGRDGHVEMMNTLSIHPSTMEHVGLMDYVYELLRGFYEVVGIVRY